MIRTILLSALLAIPAAAQTPPCIGLPDALAALQQRYGEVPRVDAVWRAAAFRPQSQAPGS